MGLKQKNVFGIRTCTLNFFHKEYIMNECKPVEKTYSIRLDRKKCIQKTFAA